MTTFADVIQFLKELETKHQDCNLCSQHIRQVKNSVVALETVGEFVSQMDDNPRLLQLLRESTKLAEKLGLLAFFARFSLLFDKFLRLVKL